MDFIFSYSKFGFLVLRSNLFLKFGIDSMGWHLQPGIHVNLGFVHLRCSSHSSNNFKAPFFDLIIQHLTYEKNAVSYGKASSTVEDPVLFEC